MVHDAWRIRNLASMGKCALTFALLIFYNMSMVDQVLAQSVTTVLYATTVTEVNNVWEYDSAAAGIPDWNCDQTGNYAQLRNGYQGSDEYLKATQFDNFILPAYNVIDDVVINVAGRYDHNTTGNNFRIRALVPGYASNPGYDTPGWSQGNNDVSCLWRAGATGWSIFGLLSRPWTQDDINYLEVYARGMPGSDPVPPNTARITAFAIVVTYHQLPGVCTTSTTSLNWGNVGYGVSGGTNTCAVANIGQGPLTGSVSISQSGSDFTILSGGGDYTLIPGASRSVAINFTPQAIGLRTATLNLGGGCSIQLQGTGLPGACTLSTMQQSFGSIAVGGSADRTLTVTNTGAGVLPVNPSISAGGSDYALVANPGATNLLPGGSLPVVVRFTPTTHGARNGTLAFGSGCTVSLTGTGLQGVGTVSPASLTFTSMLAGQEAVRSVVLSNTGNINISGLIQLASNAGAFQVITGGGEFTLAPGASRQIDVLFHPIKPKAYSDLITLGAGLPSVPLAGTGTSQSQTLYATNVVANADWQGYANAENGASSSCDNTNEYAMALDGTTSYLVADDFTTYLLPIGYMINDIKVDFHGRYNMTSTPRRIRIGFKSSTFMTDWVNRESASLSHNGTVCDWMMSSTRNGLSIRYIKRGIEWTENDINQLDLRIRQLYQGDSLDLRVTAMRIVVDHYPSGSFLITRNRVVNYGDVSMGSSVTRIIEFTNLGTANYVGNISLSGASAFTIVDGGGFVTIPPGSSRLVAVKYDPPVAAPTHTDSAVLSTGSLAGQAQLTANAIFQGYYTETSPSLTNLGNVSVGTTQTQTYTIFNYSTDPVSSQAILTSPTGRFSITSGGQPITLQPGQSHVVQVAYQPTGLGQDLAFLHFDSKGDPAVIHGSGHLSQFSGNVVVDFANRASDRDGTNDLYIDPSILEVSGQTQIPTGWDVDNVRFDFNPTSQVLNVGLDFLGVAGDADGNGVDGTVAGWVGQLRTDTANEVDIQDPSFMTSSESICMAFDFDMDDVYDMVVGKAPNETQFRAAYFVGNFAAIQNGFGGTWPNNVLGEVRIGPDVEFRLQNLQQMAPWASAYWNSNFISFNYLIYAGSEADTDLIGYEYVSGNYTFDGAGSQTFECAPPVDVIVNTSIDGSTVIVPAQDGFMRKYYEYILYAGPTTPHPSAGIQTNYARGFREIGRTPARRDLPGYIQIPQGVSDRVTYYYVSRQVSSGIDFDGNESRSGWNPNVPGLMSTD